jgi:fructose-1,6-bisphosphatase I
MAENIQLEETVMGFLLNHQEKHHRTHHFLILMDALISAAKHIEHYYLTGTLKGNIGLSGSVNVHGEDVMRMDQIAQEITIHYLRASGRVIHVVSEESDQIIPISPNGRYFVYFDPLDGSSNVPYGLPVGFMFGVAKKNLEGYDDNHLRAGRDYIAAGIFVIPTGTFTLALKDAGTWRFHIDETMEFVRPTPLTIPENTKNWELSFNSANRFTYSKSVQTWIEQNETKYAFRYIGALAADFHRTISNGGMFMYPAIVNHPDPTKNRPQGKLRLMYESAVVSFICQEAGGSAVDETGTPILDIQPKQPHQTSALYVGSKPLVESVTQALTIARPVVQ